MTEKLKELPGTSLSEKDFADGKMLYNFDKLNGMYAWDTGIAIGGYLRILEKWRDPGQPLLHLPEDRRAATHGLRVVLPPNGRVCAPARYRHGDHILAMLRHMGRPTHQGTRNPGGDQHRWSLAHARDHALARGDRSQGGEDRDRVQAVWKRPKERVGSINDILYFKPIKEA